MKEEIKDLIEYKGLDLADYTDYYQVIEALDYDGSLHELIDGNIEIYNYELRTWAVDNYEYIQEAEDQGLIADDTEYHARIQCGQYVKLQEEAYQAVEEIFNEFENVAV